MPRQLVYLLYNLRGRQSGFDSWDGMGDSLEANIISTFDALVADGVIVSGNYETIDHEEEGYPVQFRICPALLAKPHTIGAALSPTLANCRKWGPGSDMVISDERLLISQLNGTHNLALNLFCIDRPQLLILTLDSYQRQHQPLDGNDFMAALELLRQMPNMYVIYNCSEAGGCSRIHKHLQVLRGPPHAFEVLTKASGVKSAPFEYFAHHSDRGFKETSASDLLDVYTRFLGQMFQVLGLGEGDVCPHNVVLWDDWMIVIPRRKGVWKGASANAAGMVGSIWVPEKKYVDNWLLLGSANVLRELGTPL